LSGSEGQEKKERKERKGGGIHLCVYYICTKGGIRIQA
jgi:hypothetical protein